MKLVIEISEERYKDIQRIAEVQTGKRMLTCEQIIANGTPLDTVLDKIRAEIAEEYKDESEHPYGQGLRKALQIIDKYKASEE